jgi:hypothetical protein
MRREDLPSTGGIAKRHGPSTVWEVAVFVPAAGSLNYAVQRNVFEDLGFLIASHRG